MTSYSPFGNYTDVSKLMFSAKAEMELARQTEALRKQDRLWNPTRHTSAFRPVHKGHRGQSKSVVPGNCEDVVINSSHRHPDIRYSSRSRPMLPQRYRNSEHECEHFGRRSHRPVLPQRFRNCEHECEHFGKSSHRPISPQKYRFSEHECEHLGKSSFWQAPEPEDINRRELSRSVSDNRSVFQSFDPRKDVSSQRYMGANVPDDLLECLQACSITDESVHKSDGLTTGIDLDQEERLSSVSSLESVFHRPKIRSTDDLDREELLSFASDLDTVVNRKDTVGEMSAPSMSGLVERYVKQVVEQKMRERSNQSQTICVFCRRNGETREYFSTHMLKDTSGKVICPVLQKYVCPRCRATGDRAHTLRHCPLTENQTSIADTFKTPRMSNGFRKF